MNTTPFRFARASLGTAVLSISLLASACGGKDATGDTTPAPDTTEPAPATKTLFERLGGLEAIKAVTKDFVANLAADTRINTYFANSDLPKLEGLLVEQVCEATGGPCKYSGRDMRTTHTGMKLTEADFNALVEDLIKSLDKFGVPEAEKGELLGALGGMKGDIVGL